MGRSTGIIKLEDITLEKVTEFYEWLQGNSCPEGIWFEQKLELSEKQAFSVIYFLQEYLEIFPDNIERCRECGCLYDSYDGGGTINEDTTIIDENGNEVDGNFPEEMYGLYCDNCRPD